MLCLHAQGTTLVLGYVLRAKIGLGVQAFPFNEIRTEERSEAETLLLCRICSAPMQEGEERGSGAEVCHPVLF